MIHSAFISIWGQRVGAVAWNEHDGTAAFEYDPGFLQTGLELAPITMPAGHGHRFRFVEHRNSTKIKVLQF
ncbi:MAG: HipA N-terminal domain-containing protein [Cryomorphaceae bacterium]